ncbi:MAG: thioredoxin domain-containing protein [Gemmatimonas sp.]
MSKILDTAATAILLAAALAMGGAALHREFGSTSSSAARAVRGGPPTEVADWQRLKKIGNWIGDSTAAVQIVEFADFECPFCKRFHERFHEVRDSVGASVSLLVVQYPIEGHRFAVPAALAAECAARSGKWAEFADEIFQKQDSLGLKSWTSYALSAGIADTVAFNSCVATNVKSARVDSSRAAGQSLNLSGTPTVLINGWRYSSAPYDSLLAIVKTQIKDAK